MTNAKLNSSGTPEILTTVQPKIENSPPPNRTYDQILQRQTVLMWGANHHNPNEISPNHISNSQTRSPCQTPKSASFGVFNNSATSSPVSQVDKSIKDVDAHQSLQHIKWNGNTGGNVNNKEVISIFPIHNNEASFPSSSASLHSIESRYSNHNRHGEMANCEVWPSAYSQYQYFPYHHVPNAHHQHPTSTQ
jgi:hypothetical protein